MENKIPTYIKYSNNVLQVFFAVLAFIEKEQHNRTFLFDNQNIEILKECEKHICFDKLQFSEDISIEYEIINIEISHENPNTYIVNYKSAPLIFPKILFNTFFQKTASKKKQIYFRGLLTKKRILEIIQLFVQINDFKAIISLIRRLINKKRDFIIETDKVYICFTKRGRQKAFKYLDTDYYQEMANYKYVFCPSGDFIWTYRFFEAIQLGAIPITKHSTTDYQKFFFYKKASQKINNEQESKAVEENLSTFQEIYNI